MRYRFYSLSTGAMTIWERMLKHSKVSNQRAWLPLVCIKTFLQQHLRGVFLIVLYVQATIFYVIQLQCTAPRGNSGSLMASIWFETNLALNENFWVLFSQVIASGSKDGDHAWCINVLVTDRSNALYCNLMRSKKLFLGVCAMVKANNRLEWPVHFQLHRFLLNERRDQRKCKACFLAFSYN